MDVPGIEGEVFYLTFSEGKLENECILKAPSFFGDKVYKISGQPKWYWRLLNSITFDLIPYLSQKSRTFKIEEA